MMMQYLSQIIYQFKYFKDLSGFVSKVSKLEKMGLNQPQIVEILSALNGAEFESLDDQSTSKDMIGIVVRSFYSVNMS